jgi:hypothetical protein
MANLRRGSARTTAARPDRGKVRVGRLTVHGRAILRGSVLPTSDAFGTFGRADVLARRAMRSDPDGMTTAANLAARAARRGTTDDTYVALVRWGVGNRVARAYVSPRGLPPHAVTWDTRKVNADGAPTTARKRRSRAAIIAATAPRPAPVVVAPDVLAAARAMVEAGAIG